MKYILPVLFFLTVNCITAQEVYRNDTVSVIQGKKPPVWGAGITVSSFGPGVVFFRDVKKNVRLKGTASYFFYNYSLHKLVPDLKGDAKLRVGGVGVFSDLFFGRYFFISGGLSTNFNRLNVTGQMAESIMVGDVEMTPEDIGSLSVAIKPAWPVSPYMGFGIGKKISKTGRFGFSLEIGAFLQGEPRVKLAATGMLTPTASEEQEQIMQNNIKPIDFWPKIGININYKITSNDKNKVVQ